MVAASRPYSLSRSHAGPEQPNLSCTPTRRTGEMCIRDSVETALNSAGDVEFAATAEYHQWLKQGKPLPDFLRK